MADATQQSFNRSNTWKFKINDEWLSLRAVCSKLGLNYKSVHYAVKVGGKDPIEILGESADEFYRPYDNYDDIIKEN